MRLKNDIPQKHPRERSTTDYPSRNEYILDKYILKNEKKNIYHDVFPKYKDFPISPFDKL